jgi:chromosome condensin MukBEF complex kleisin-like MukF subunit
VTSPLRAEAKNGGAIPPLPPLAFIVLNYIIRYKELLHLRLFLVYLTIVTQIRLSNIE